MVTTHTAYIKCIKFPYLYINYVLMGKRKYKNKHETKVRHLIALCKCVCEE